MARPKSKFDKDRKIFSLPLSIYDRLYSLEEALHLDSGSEVLGAAMSFGDVIAEN